MVNFASYALLNAVYISPSLFVSIYLPTRSSDESHLHNILKKCIVFNNDWTTFLHTNTFKSTCLLNVTSAGNDVFCLI